MRDCRVCLLPCDPEIHAATLRVHSYLRQETKRRLVAVDLTPKKSGHKRPAVVAGGSPWGKTPKPPVSDDSLASATLP